MNVIIALLCFILTAISCNSNNTHYAFTPSSSTDHWPMNHWKLSNSTRYCYHFTWMGGNFNNKTFKNIKDKTCNQYFKDKNTLCINPMVATYLGGEPDIKYILYNYPKAATCRLSQEQVCAKYTVFYNGIVSYMTRYCTRININLEGPMQSGCIQESIGSQVIEVCACKSEPGPDGICNSALPSFFIQPVSILSSSSIGLLLMRMTFT